MHARSVPQVPDTVMPTDQVAGHRPAAMVLTLEVARASLAYVRDTVEITRGGHDLLDALILTAALDANMAPVARDPDLRTVYGGVAVSAPDALRRPVSVNAVAQSLHLPFETVRRRFQNLSRAGLCVIGSQGVIIPLGAVTSAAYMAEQRARYDRAGALYQALKTVGGLLEAPTLPLSPSVAAPPVRAANWALSEYTLRACDDLIALTGNVLSSRVLLELALANTLGLKTDALAAWILDPAVVGQAVRIPALAASLRMSGETARRHLRRLNSLGFCRRTSGGLVAVAPAWAWPRLAGLLEANQVNIQRLFGRLRQLGVLDLWDASPSR
jgi:predicted transcriptional regulator